MDTGALNSIPPPLVGGGLRGRGPARGSAPASGLLALSRGNPLGAKCSTRKSIIPEGCFRLFEVIDEARDLRLALLVRRPQQGRRVHGGDHGRRERPWNWLSPRARDAKIAAEQR